MKNPEIAKKIARQLRSFHQVAIPGSREPQLWNDIFKFLNEGHKTYSSYFMLVSLLFKLEKYFSSYGIGIFCIFFLGTIVFTSKPIWINIWHCSGDTKIWQQWEASHIWINIIQWDPCCNRRSQGNWSCEYVIYLLLLAAIYIDRDWSNNDNWVVIYDIHWSNVVIIDSWILKRIISLALDVF